MATKSASIVGKIIYGGVFTVAVPILLIVWARLTERSVPLPAIDSLPAGVMIGAAGAALMIAGMAAIYFYGHGLPMNAYPPARFVTEGVYRFVPHPIYTGFSVLCLGAAIAAGSASGLWLVFPTVVIGCVALVQGYEKEATQEHFGDIGQTALIHLPPAESGPPTIVDRISAYILAILPWMIFIQATRLIAEGPTPLSPLSWEPVLPIYGWAEPIYLCRFLLIAVVPLAVATRRDLREFMINALAATGLAAVLFVAFPSVFSPAAIDQPGIFHNLLLREQDLGGRSLFSLSSHVAWTLLAARFLAPRYTRISYLLAAIVMACGLATGNQSFTSVLAGSAIYFTATKIRRIWEFLRRGTERVANSWTEWRFGPVRVINHGIYAGAGAFVSLSIIGILTGPANVSYVIMIALAAIVMSSLSAQWIEGSSKLLRPYGWYGGVLGSFLGGFIAYIFGANIWLLIGAFCVGAPWVQAAGRLRCLIQGCCHGRPTNEAFGIRYWHPMSRVCRLADLKDVHVHPTPLYSILYNAVVAIITAPLWLSGASLTLIFGIYYILTGLGRFVEESLRGEPQTPIVGGLRLYQLLAVSTVVGGIFATMIGNVGNAPIPQFNWKAMVASAAFGVFIWLAFGVDLPKSNWRFARLT